MYKYTWMLSLMFLFTITSNAQLTLRGTIINAKTEQPIPFVNVGVQGKDIGTVSGEDGKFELEVSDGALKVSIFTIGYEQQDFTAFDLQNQRIIKLQSKSYDLELIEVDASRLGEEVILGSKLDKKQNSIGFSSTKLGAEMGAYIKVDKETFLKSANFIFNHTRKDSLFYRVNIYKVEKEKVVGNILPEPLVIQHVQDRGTLTIDLSKYNLVIDHDVILALEWIKDDEGIGTRGISFNSKRAGAKNNVFLKTTSFAGFKRLADYFNYAPKLTLGFYFVGKQVQKK